MSHRAKSNPSIKRVVLERLLSRAKGATITELAVSAGWQAHSCRAFLSGLRKQGCTLLKEQRPNGDLTYRLVKQTTESAAGSVNGCQQTNIRRQENATADKADMSHMATTDKGATQ